MPPKLLKEGLGEDIPDALIHKECWTRTGKAILLNAKPVELKTLPLGTSLFADAIPLCNIQLGTDGLWIEPSSNASISLQRTSDDKVVEVSRKQRLKTESRSGTSYWIHLGAIQEEHAVWRFNW